MARPIDLETARVEALARAMEVELRRRGDPRGGFWLVADADEVGVARWRRAARRAARSMGLRVVTEEVWESQTVRAYFWLGDD